MADADFTTVGVGPGSEHRWTSETGAVEEEHPFSAAISPAMVIAEK